MGRELFERFVSILASVDDAWRAVPQAQGAPQGTLRLTCRVEFGLIAVSRWLAGCPRRYPQMQGGRELRYGAELVRAALRPRMRVNNSLAVRDAACEGLGVALLPLPVAERLVDEGRLMAVLPEWAPPAAPEHAVLASARYLTPKVRAFIDHAVEEFRGTAA